MITRDEARNLYTKWKNDILNIKVDGMFIDDHIKSAASRGFLYVEISLKDFDSIHCSLEEFVAKVTDAYSRVGFDVEHRVEHAWAKPIHSIYISWD